MQKLEGNLVPLTSTKEARKLIGKRIEYLTRRDIDTTGRGYFFPRRGTVENVYARNIMISGDWLTFSSIREIIIINE